MTTKTKAFYVRFQITHRDRGKFAAMLDRFMGEFIRFLEEHGLGPTGDMSPSGQGVFLILGINSRSEQVIVDVKEGDPALVDEWLTKRGVPHEVGKIDDIEIGPGTTTQKEAP